MIDDEEDLELEPVKTATMVLTGIYEEHIEEADFLWGQREDALAVYDEYSVELVMSLFEASELAWNVLLNLLEHFSKSVERVVLVAIE